MVIRTITFVLCLGLVPMVCFVKSLLIKSIFKFEPIRYLKYIVFDIFCSPNDSCKSKSDGDRTIVFHKSGKICHYKNNEIHREDGPAIDAYNFKMWYLNGQCHRINGPAYVSRYGDMKWFQNNELHRIGAPAIEYDNGDREWHQHGKLHREDGPALEFADGRKIYYYNDKRFSSLEDFDYFKRTLKLKAFW